MNSIKDFLESLGWEYDFFWNNRDFYHFPHVDKYGLFIHLHDDSVGLVVYKQNNDFRLVYCNLKKGQIRRFTNSMKKNAKLEEFLNEIKM